MYLTGPARLINISDREDEEGIKWSFELCQRDQQRVILKSDSAEEKQAWMASLGEYRLGDTSATGYHLLLFSKYLLCKTGNK